MLYVQHTHMHMHACMYPQTHQDVPLFVFFNFWLHLAACGEGSTLRPLIWKVDS